MDVLRPEHAATVAFEREAAADRSVHPPDAEFDAVEDLVAGLGLRQGFVFTDADGMRGLNQLIDPTAGWYVLGAGDINDAANFRCEM